MPQAYRSPGDQVDKHEAAGAGLERWTCTLLPYRPVAQLAERLSPKQEVVGSIPAWPARKVNAVFKGGVLGVK